MAHLHASVRRLSLMLAAIIENDIGVGAGMLIFTFMSHFTPRQSCEM